MGDNRDFDRLESFLKLVPAIVGEIGKGRFENGNWWVKFAIDVDHPLAWSVVQEFGCVLNYISLNERLPTAFMPVSPAPYLNGGPRDFLLWVIESTDPKFKPGTAKNGLRKDCLNRWMIFPHGRVMNSGSLEEPVLIECSLHLNSARFGT
ncbi:MAG: hypothetical protein QUS14_02710 [Pyrinomonadaceae bacterium]|nr:hypothetical protein [Pyrinomonadaceae bacterium]